jgi:hypothetical protein
MREIGKMLSKIMAVCLFALTACGPEPATECRIEGLLKVTGQSSFDCIKMEYNFNLAKQILVSKGLVSQRDADSSFYVNVRVLDEDEWKLGSEEVNGQYIFPDNIKLARGGSLLLHEMLHHWDAWHLAIFTYKHMNWDTNGYNEASYQFESDCEYLDE